MGREGMKWWRLRHFRQDSDLREEMNAHQELQAEDYRDQSISPAEADRRARAQLGRTLPVIETVRDQEFITMLESLWRDLVIGLRSLRKNPVFFFTAVLTLALGIGANAAIFGLLYGLVLRSLPVKSPGQLAYIHLFSPGFQWNGLQSVLPFGMVRPLQQRAHSFEDISAWGIGSTTMQDPDGDVHIYNMALVSGNGFSLLGVRPELGRLIGPSDDVRGGSREGWPVVLSYGFWNDRFGRDPHVVGRQIRVQNFSVTVAGVLPRSFTGLWPGIDTQMYLPLQFQNVLEGVDNLNTPGSFSFFVALARLRPGVSVSAAGKEVAHYGNDLLRDFVPLKYKRRPYLEKAELRVDSARSGLPTYLGHVYSQPLYMMQGLVVCILLLCCVNVGGLMMSKVYARQREFAVRNAIGAARWRLVRQYLTESFIIAVVGAALGGAAAWYGTSFLLVFFRDPNMGQSVSVRPDSTMFVISGLIAVFSTLLFGTLPAWRAGGADPGSLLTTRSSLGRRRQIAGKAFVPVQVALSLILVVISTLLSQSLVHLRSERTGFEVDHVTIQTPPFFMLPQRGDALLDLYGRMVDRLQQMPGIRYAAVTWYTPMTGIQSTAEFQPSGGQGQRSEDVQLAYNDVGPGYFRTMNTQILAGREFARNERTTDVCVLNQVAAERLFSHEQAIARYVRANDPHEFPHGVSCRVVGIAENAKFANLRDAPPATIYFPLHKDSNALGGLVLLMNSATEAQAVSGYRTALREIVPTMPLVIFVTLRDQMDAALGSQRLITWISKLFGGLALLLSAIGLYGLLSSSVAQRINEIGVRMALGAQRRTVLQMILAEAFWLLGIGVVAGVVGLIFSLGFVKNILYGISAFDPLTWIGTIGLLMLVTLLAGAFPAMRAASVDPMEALRSE